jgi:hypothetical protein
MGFFSEPYWWAQFIGATVLFGIYCRMGLQGAGSPFKNLIRTAFVSLAAVSFILTGWRGGLGVCVGGALVGYLVPALLGRTLVKPVVAVPSKSVSRVPTEQLLLGRRALVRDMIFNGISRQKVWRLVQQGKLVAHEDPKDGRISLVRPEDLDVLQGAEHGGRDEGGRLRPMDASGRDNEEVRGGNGRFLP